MPSSKAAARARAQFTDAEAERLIALRRELHQHPELSWKEQATAQRLERELADLGAKDIRRVADTGVVGRIPGLLRDGPITAIRGDIDALPIVEATGVEWASKVPGVMHACGHDVHATWAIGAARLLSRARPQSSPPARSTESRRFTEATSTGASKSDRSWRSRGHSPHRRTRLRSS